MRVIINSSGRVIKESGDQELVARWNREAELEMLTGIIDWDYPYEISSIDIQCSDIDRLYE